jgi:cobalamin-dependent methionine synthase-like protein
MSDELAGTGVTAFRVPFDALDVRLSRVAAAMGYEDAVVPEHYVDQIKQGLAEASDHTEVQAGFRQFGVGSLSVNTTGFFLDGVRFAADRIIAAGLRGSTSLVIFTATAGPAFDAWIRSHFDRNDLVTGFLIDSLGSEVAEAAVDWVETRIQETAKEQGLGFTNRYSPGYCGWSVAEQQQLFRFLPDRFCGISLTPTSLMMPRKSVSGVIGLGPGVARRDYTCRVCDSRDCYRRRAMFEE